MKHTKEYLELENKWLWYNSLVPEDNAVFIDVRQYDKKGKLIATSSELLVPKKYRVKHPDEILGADKWTKQNY